MLFNSNNNNSNNLISSPFATPNHPYNNNSNNNNSNNYNYNNGNGNGNGRLYTRPNVFANSLLTSGANFHDLSQDDDEVYIISNAKSNFPRTNENNHNNGDRRFSSHSASIRMNICSPNETREPFAADDVSKKQLNLSDRGGASAMNPHFDLLPDDDESVDQQADREAYFIDDDYEDGDIDDYDDDVIFFSQIEDMNFLKEELAEESDSDELDGEEAHDRGVDVDGQFSSQSGSTDSGPASQQQRNNDTDRHEATKLQNDFNINIISDDDEESDNLLEL
jgi:hypothetical protein